MHWVTLSEDDKNNRSERLNWVELLRASNLGQLLRTFSVQHRDTDILRVWFILSEVTTRTSVDAYCFPWALECASNLCRYIVTFLCGQGVSLNVSFTGVEIPSQVRRILPALNASAWCFWSPSIIQTSGRHGGVKLSHVSSKTQSSSSWIKG